MRLRGTLTTALALAALTATPSLAAVTTKAGLPAAKPVSWTDVAGDANGLNDESGLSPAGPSNMATPGSIASDDLLAVTFARLDNSKTVSGLTVTMKLSAPPAAGALYRITGSAAGCSTFWFQYYWGLGASPVATLRHNCGVAASTTSATTTVSVPIDAKVVGSSIVWTLKLTDLPAGIKLGSVLSPTLAEVRAILGAAGTGLTLPTIDQTDVQTATYKIGQ